MFFTSNPVHPLLLLLAPLKLELPFSVGLEKNNVKSRFMRSPVSKMFGCLYSLKSVD